MTILDMVTVMSGGTTVKISLDCKEVFFGKLSGLSKSTFDQIKDKKIYRVNVDRDTGAITMAV